MHNGQRLLRPALVTKKEFRMGREGVGMGLHDRDHRNNTICDVWYCHRLDWFGGALMGPRVSTPTSKG